MRALSTSEAHPIGAGCIEKCRSANAGSSAMNTLHVGQKESITSSRCPTPGDDVLGWNRPLRGFWRFLDWCRRRLPYFEEIPPSVEGIQLFGAQRLTQDYCVSVVWAHPPPAKMVHQHGDHADIPAKHRVHRYAARRPHHRRRHITNSCISDPVAGFRLITEFTKSGSVVRSTTSTNMERRNSSPCCASSRI